MKIRAFTVDSGSAWWRLESIANYVTMNTDHEMLCFNHKYWNDDIFDGDLVIFQMVINPEAIKKAKALGAKVIYEMDDYLTGRVGRKEINDRDLFTSGMKECIQEADMVTVTTEALKESISHLNNNVVVLPNYIDPIWWGKPLNIKRRGEIRLGWAGSTSHRSDLFKIAPVIKRILDEYDDVKFIYCGAGGVSSSNASTELLYGEDIFKDIPPERREYRLGVNYELWGNMSKTLHFDIAIAPLIDDTFNKCKSNIKWQEYSLNGWAGVYSDSESYKDITNALKAKNNEEFYQQIKFLIDNPEERMKLAKQSQRDVLKNWTLDKHYKEWIKAYQKCLSQ